MEHSIKVPTGYIGIYQGEKGLLEYVSIGDYGKDKNIKADFLGYTREINQVPHGEIEPLEDKWVVTISTQYGCSMGCKFCDVPKVGKGINATEQDLKGQVLQGLEEFPEVKTTKRLNIHFARMGEPSFNPAVLKFARTIPDMVTQRLDAEVVHPVVSTALPRTNKKLLSFLQEWCKIKNDVYQGDAGLQFSINSTDDAQRQYMFGDSSLSLDSISEIATELPQPKGRKYALNFALADGFVVDANRLRQLFDPEKFMVKITPIHLTKASRDNNIKTTQGYFDYSPYRTVENNLKDAGFDVLVFIPSVEEDTSGITCGNAILSNRDTQVS